MNGGNDKAQKPSILGARANGQTFLPSLTARGPFSNPPPATKSNGAPSKENKSTTMATSAHARKQSASSLSDVMPSSPDVSRIPRPTSHASPRTRRRSLTLEEAFDLAEHRRLIGSPSPAPRPPRQNSASSEQRPLPHMFSQRPIDLGRLGKVRPGSTFRRDGTLTSKDSFGSSARKVEESDSELGRKLKQFEEDEKIIKSMKEDKKGLSFNKPKFGFNGAGPRAASAIGSNTGSIGNNGLGKSSTVGGAPRPTWGTLHDNNPNWLKKFEPAVKMAAEEDARRGIAGVKRQSPTPGMNRPTVEQDSPLVIPRPATAAPLHSPDKSYAWQVDEDFTAGDLQFSNSPPWGFGRGNTKLDELRRLEIDAERNNPVERHRFTPQRTNTKLDEILQREREVERKYPVPLVEEPTTESVDDLPMSDETRPSLWSLRPAKGDSELYDAQETEDLINKPLAPTRWDELRKQQAPRFPSPEPQRKNILEVSHQPQSRVNPEARLQSQENGFVEMDGEKVPDTPVTIYRRTFPWQTSNEQNEPHMNGVPPADPVQDLSHEKKDSHDLLRRLARASSKSPSPSPVQEKPAEKSQEENKVALSSGKGEEDKPKQDQQFVSDNKGPEVNGILRAPLAGANKPFSFSKPTVGFAGIPRSTSTKSVASMQSRSSADPTARIEAEMNLFAPRDNMSERGSTRPPSPQAEAGTQSEDATPKPTKIDPLSMPTPQVTGAYVESPVASKYEQPDVKKDVATLQREFLPLKKKSELRDRDISTSPRATKSDGQQERMRSTSISKLRRSRSLPRRTGPLKNSVKPPTVKEDLQQIHMLNNIEDSTLDDFTDLIVSSNNPEELKQILRNGVTDADDMDDISFEQQLKRFDQLGKSLNAGLAGIRQAKKGIERLENRVAHAEKPATAVKNEDSDKSSTGRSTRHAHDPECPHCVDVQQKGATTYLHVPVPRLLHSQSKFKPTLLGFLLLFLSSWYFLENAFHERWGRQYICYRGSPCRYEMDDPDYGYVVPVKLDEWLTGGMIRPHAAHWLEEISDYYADAQDWWTGIDIRDVDWRGIRDPDKRRNHFRRMDKRGLWPDWNPDPDMIPMIEALERQRLAEEAAEALEDPYYGFAGERMVRDNVLPGDRTGLPSIRWS